MANIPKYIPPHLRRTVQAQEKEEPRCLPLKTSTFTRWQGERPSPSRASFSTSRPSSSGSSHCGPQPLLQAHGDSFVGPLKLLERVVDVHRYSGATAKGLGNDKSEQQVGRRIVDCLDKTRPEKVLLQFGNVDINISSVYRIETSGADAWNETKFVADVWEPFEAYLRAHILPRLDKPPECAPKPGDPPTYIRQLYLCKATLPVVHDDALPESHAKYQYPKRGDGGPERNADDEAQLLAQARTRMERVTPLVALCGIDARRRMTADFNARLGAFVAQTEAARRAEAVHSTQAIHAVDLNKYIRVESGSDDVAAQYVTSDPTNLHVAWETTLPFWIKELATTGLRPYDMPTQGQLQEQWAEYASRKVGQMEVMKQRRHRRSGSHWESSPGPSPIWDGTGPARWPGAGVDR